MSTYQQSDVRDLRRRYRFFLDEAAYVVGERAQGALALARADRALLHEPDYRAIWEPDPDADRSWEPDDGDTYDYEWCRLERKCPRCQQFETVESLGGICNAGNNYRRVIEAELMAEHLATEER